MQIIVTVASTFAGSGIICCCCPQFSSKSAFYVSGRNVCAKFHRDCLNMAYTFSVNPKIGPHNYPFRGRRGRLRWSCYCHGTHGVGNPYHVLYRFLPHTFSTSQFYSLRPRAHDKKLLGRFTHLKNNNFIIHMLFYDVF